MIDRLVSSSDTHKASHILSTPNHNFEFMNFEFEFKYKPFVITASERQDVVNPT